MHKPSTHPALILSLSLLSACSQPIPTPDASAPDAMDDAARADDGPDIVDVTRADASLDALPDGAQDAAIDAQPDGPMDSTLDSQPDSQPDVAVDSQPDSRPDVAVDSQPDSQPDAMPDALPDAAPVATTFARGFSGTGFEVVRRVAANADGVYAVGDFSGTVDFGAGSVTTAGTGLFVVALTHGGGVRWTLASTAAVSSAQNVAFDSAGNVFVVGFYGGAGLSGWSTAASSSDAFVASYSRDGALRWMWRIGGVGEERATGVAIDAANSVYVSGSFAGSVDFGTGPVIPTGVDGFVARYTNLGSFASVAIASGASDQRVNEVAIRNVGGVVQTDVAGEFEGSVTLGGRTTTSRGGVDAFVARLRSDGTAQWLRSFGSTGTDTAATIATSASNVVAVGGSFSNSVDFGTGPSAARGTDGFVLWLDGDTSSTTRVRTISGAGSAGDFALDLAADGDATIVAGLCDGTTTLGATMLACGTNGAAFVAGLDGAGDVQWTASNAAAGASAALGVALSPMRGAMGRPLVVVGGRFSSTLDLGSGSLTGRAPAPDGFVTVIAP
ncbi:MAG: hypothetical protein JNK05_36335 [Myxococcales bacterium]|nr:hypothetical protein [Myxococcales bacterium]